MSGIGGGIGVNGSGTSVGVNGSGHMGVQGLGVGLGVRGEASSGVGVLGDGEFTGVQGFSRKNGFNEGKGVSGFGFYGIFGEGVDESSSASYGVFARGNKYGVRGDARGMPLSNSDTYGVYGKAAPFLLGGGINYAGYFDGPVHMTQLSVTQDVIADGINVSSAVVDLVEKKVSLFKIDHPLDPANKYLKHSVIESSEMMNLYHGNAILDATGEAWVTLPDWFEALNREIHYQLTTIGGYAPVYIGQEVSFGQFQIAGGTAGLKVSWQLTGVRQDAHAVANPLLVEEPKADEDQGKYLAPEAYGLPASMGIRYREPAEEPAP